MKIGIGGKMRSGKDTVTEILIKYFSDNGKDVGHYKFSEGISKIINEYGYKEYTVKPRVELQQIGQGLRQILGEDVWVNYTLKHIKGEEDVVIISDVRQENEVNRLKEEGYLLIYVEREDATRVEEIKNLNEEVTDDILNHETEKVSKTKFDILIDNNKSLYDLEKEVIDLAKTLLR